MNSFKRYAGVFAIAIALTGCATTNDPRDPFEGFNRAMFSLNDKIDQAALKPAATVYQNTVPLVVQIGVGNFFGNIGDVWTSVNNLLQGKMADGVTDMMRVIVNSTFGLGGLIDIGSDVGMVKHNEDFGQTLAVWGVASGPYVVLPFLGPTTLRDTLALPADVYGDLWSYKRPVGVRNAGAALRVVDQRSVVLDATNLIEDAALDRYEFIRDGFLQRRANNVNDGESKKPRLDEQSRFNLAPVQVAKPDAQSIQFSDSDKRDNGHRSDSSPTLNTKVIPAAADGSNGMTPSISVDANQLIVHKPYIE